MTFLYCCSVSAVVLVVAVLTAVATLVITLVLAWMLDLFCLLRSWAFLSCSRKCCGLFNCLSFCSGVVAVVVGRLCFAQSYLLRPCITWPVEVQNSYPIG